MNGGASLAGTFVDVVLRELPGCDGAPTVGLAAGKIAACDAVALRVRDLFW